MNGGVYRVVRHPIYVGYLLTHAAFLLSHPTIWNVVVFGAGDVALVALVAFVAGPGVALGAMVDREK